MKLSKTLRNHQWQVSSSATVGGDWHFSDAPLKAAELLDECEACLREILSDPDLVGPRDGEKSILAHARLTLSKLRDRETTPELRLFYVRENNTLRELPKDIDAAIETVRDEFVAGHTRGMLCCKGEDMQDVCDGLYAHGVENWADFETKARQWLSHSLDVGPLQKDR
jgi:hypothetical protein